MCCFRAHYTKTNGIQGELDDLRRSGHQQWCPIMASLNRVRHLCTHQAPLDMPIFSYFSNTWHKIDTITTLTHHLCIAVTALETSFGIQPYNISIFSLWSSSAMALLCAKVDPDMICLLGHWQSDVMLCYLHIQTFPIVAPLASQMLYHGHSSLITNHGG